MKDKWVGCVYETQEYGKFKKLDGNRAVTDGRKKRIMNSIAKNGYILSPLCVNEHMEVIDGQGRLEALKELNLPVHYYVAPGTGRKECIAMNVYGKPWVMEDYVMSYAETGNENYKRLLFLMPTYKRAGISFNVIYKAATESYATNEDDKLKTGLFTLTTMQMMEAETILDKLSEILPFFKMIGGRMDNICIAFIYILRKQLTEESEIERLINAIKTLYAKMPPSTDVKTSLKVLNDAYNYRIGAKNRVYWLEDYDRYTHKRLSISQRKSRERRQ